MANSVNITGSDFEEVYKALDKVSERAGSSSQAIDKIFNTDWSSGKLFQSLNGLNGKLAMAKIRADSLAKAIKGIKGIDSVKVDAIGGGAGGGGKKAGVPEGTDESGDLNAMTKFRRAMVKFEKREADWLAKQRENSANETFRRLVKQTKDAEKQKERAAKMAEKSAAADAAVIKKTLSPDDFVKQNSRPLLAPQSNYSAEMQKLANKYAVQNFKAEERLRLNAEKSKPPKPEPAPKMPDPAKEKANPKSDRDQYAAGLLGLPAWLKRMISDRSEITQLRQMQRQMFDLKTIKSLFGSGTLVSKFGNPGQNPLMLTRFRVFQRPFPGSERNPFSIGDASNLGSNVIDLAARGTGKAFTLINNAASDVMRGMSGLAQVALYAGGALMEFFPLTKFAGEMMGGLAKILGIVSEQFLAAFDGMTKVLGEAVTAIGTFAVGLASLAFRAVNASSTLTELKNAAKIYAGDQGSQNILNTATKYQESYGLSMADSVKMMTRMTGQFRQSTGMTSDAASTQATEMFRAFADAGSVLNIDLATIGNLVQSAMAGRYTPMRRMGVLVSAESLRQVAKSQGFDKTAKTPFEAQTRSLISEVKRQTKQFIGDLDNTQYEFANLQRKILGQFESGFVKVGRAMEPFARLLLIASTALGDKFLGNLDRFASGVDSAFQAMKDRYNVSQTPENLENMMLSPQSDFEKSIWNFAHGINWVVDRVLYFGKALWESRFAIAEFGKQAVNKLFEVASSMTQFSLSVIDTAMAIVDSLTPVIGAMTVFGDAMLGLASLVDRIANGSMATRARKRYEADAANETRFQEIENGRRIGSHNVHSTPAERESLLADSTARQARLKQYNEKLQQYYNNPNRDAFDKVYDNAARPNRPSETAASGVAAYMDFANPLASQIKEGASTTLGAVRDSVEAAKKQLAIAQGKVSGIDGKEIPQNRFATEYAMPKLLKMGGKYPDMAPALPITPKTGKMSEYFSPAAYRDEVMTRELNAAEQTATNTGTMAEQLSGIAATIDRMLQAPGAILSPLQMRAVTTV